MQNFGQLRDLYLPTNTLAALANLAPQVTALHPHAAQRLLGLTSALAKRYVRVARRVEVLTGQQPQQEGAAAAAGVDQQQQAQQQVAQHQQLERLQQDQEVGGQEQSCCLFSEIVFAAE